MLRGIGQVFFQENALTGALLRAGDRHLLPAPWPLGIVVGSAIGAPLAWGLKYDKGEVIAGIYGFNPALVGIATLFFYQPGPVTIPLLVVGCVVATLLTRLMRGYVPFPTYTTPFIVTTWVVLVPGSGDGRGSHAT